MPLDGFEMTPEDEKILDDARAEYLASRIGLSLAQWRAMTPAQRDALVDKFQELRNAREPEPKVEPDEVATYG
jgi:hypothetical protein